MPEIIKENAQFLIIGAFVALGILLHLALRPKPTSTRPKWIREWMWQFVCPLRAAIGFNAILLTVTFCLNFAGEDSYDDVLLSLSSLGLAWLFAAFIAATTNSSFGAWFIGGGISILGLLKTLPVAEDVYRKLSDPAYYPTLGKVSITPYSGLKTFVMLTAFFLLAGSIVKPVENYLRKRRDIKASSRSLIVQMLKIALYTAVVMISLNVLGVDLTTLTVFGGALGVGLGFGLQKITSNFVSGIILLLEQSVEEGDLIELDDGTLGFIRKNSARYTLVETFDSKEILVPNEDFITHRVTNWTYSNANGRIEVHVGVSYKSDIELARKLILESATEYPLTVSEPPAICYLSEFGDSSVNFILHFWISDIKVGRFKPIDAVMTKIWHAFKENDIEIPYPQRDLHLRSIDETVSVPKSR